MKRLGKKEKRTCTHKHQQIAENHDDNIKNYDEINCEYCCNIFHENARDDPNDYVGIEV